MHASTRFLLAAIASGTTVFAQTSSLCNPTLQGGCPVDPALARAVEYDFTQGAPEDFTVSTGSAPTFTKDGAVFTIAKKGDAPTLSSKWYMMFGHYDIQVKTAPGVGVVSSLVLLSDDLDEIDFEWLGADNANVQTNYFGKGKTTSYTREMTVPVSNNQEEFHTYSLDWTAESVVWSIDGKPVRTLTPETAEANQYPQSPMQLKIGPWVGGDVGAGQGTIEWAGGLIDWSKAPFTMTVTSVKVVDYSTGKSYSYGDQTGDWQSIKSDGGKINSKGDPNTPVSSVAAAGTAISATESGAAATAGAVLNNVAANGNNTSNATVTSGSAHPTGTSGATQITLSTSAGPYSNATASTTQVSGSSGASGTNTQATHTAGAARFGASVGALAFAAAVLVL